MCTKKNWLANTGKVGSYQCSYIVSWIAYCSCDGPLTLSSVLDWIFCPEGKDEFEPSFFFFFWNTIIIIIFLKRYTIIFNYIYKNIIGHTLLRHKHFKVFVLHLSKKKKGSLFSVCILIK